MYLLVHCISTRADDIRALVNIIITLLLLSQLSSNVMRPVSVRGFSLQLSKESAKPMSNIRSAYDKLTGDWISERSGGKIKPLSPQGAAGILGGFIVETGSEDLTNLDVIENKARAGRGISQFTGVRRGPYDAARLAAIKAGIDPHDLDFQLGYVVDEYLGKHDKNGNSLSGWTKSFENFGQSDNVRDAAVGWTVGKDGKEGYFRPRTPHLDRRIEAAERVHTRMTAPRPIPDLGVPVEVKTPTITSTRKTDPYAGINTL